MRTLLTGLLLAAPATAQAAAQLAAGPPVPWPNDCPIPYTFTNDTDVVLGVTPCLPPVLDEVGSIVYIAPCAQILVLIPPGGVDTKWWGLNDEQGPVEAGVY